MRGYHALGHGILDGWLELRAAGTAAPGPEVVALAVRDMRLLVGLLDSSVDLTVSLAEAIASGGTLRRVADSTGSPRADAPVDSGSRLDDGEPQGDQPVAPTEVSAPSNDAGIWPDEEFANLVALGQYVQRRHGIAMTAITKASGKTVRELSIAEAKRVVEGLLAQRGERS